MEDKTVWECGKCGEVFLEGGKSIDAIMHRHRHNKGMQTGDVKQGRKIIQLADWAGIKVALCDDGTIWRAEVDLKMDVELGKVLVGKVTWEQLTTSEELK